MRGTLLIGAGAVALIGMSLLAAPAWGDDPTPRPRPSLTGVVGPGPLPLPPTIGSSDPPPMPVVQRPPGPPVVFGTLEAPAPSTAETTPQTGSAPAASSTGPAPGASVAGEPVSSGGVATAGAGSQVLRWELLVAIGAEPRLERGHRPLGAHPAKRSQIAPQE